MQLYSIDTIRLHFVLDVVQLVHLIMLTGHLQISAEHTGPIMGSKNIPQRGFHLNPFKFGLYHSHFLPEKVKIMVGD